MSERLELALKGLELLSTGISKAQDMERLAVSSAKELAERTDTLVHDNPWRSRAVTSLVAAGIGIAVCRAISSREY